MKKIEITTNMTGYPEHLHTGYTDFDSFEDALKFAEENNGRVVDLYRKNGWQFWRDLGPEYEPYTITAEMYGDDYEIIADVEAWDNNWQGLLSASLADMTAEDLMSFAKNVEKITEIIANLDDDKGALFCRGEFCEVIKTSTMSYNIDVDHHSIGVVIEEEE